MKSHQPKKSCNPKLHHVTCCAQGCFGYSSLIDTATRPAKRHVASLRCYVRYWAEKIKNKGCRKAPPKSPSLIGSATASRRRQGLPASSFDGDSSLCAAGESGP